MNRLLSAALVAALTAALPADGQIVFSEDFDDGAAAARWSAPFVDAENGVFDGAVDYAFDYSAVGIPAAPNGGGTVGTLMEVNTTSQTGDQGETVGVFPTGFSLPSGSFRFTADVYFNVETANSGTTEYAHLSVHTAGPNSPGDDSIQDDVPFRFGLSQGDGLTWQFDGDAGSVTDLFRYEDAGNADAGAEVGLGSYDDLPAGVIPGVSTGNNATGPTNSWVTVEIERFGSIVSFSMNGYEIDSILDLAGEFNGGSIQIGYSDPFNSVGVKTYEVGPDPTPFDDSDGPFGDDIPGFAHFVVFDNVVVESIVPEPASAAIACVALAGMAATRRR